MRVSFGFRQSVDEDPDAGTYRMAAVGPLVHPTRI
jgi:hypothetical protein